MSGIAEILQHQRQLELENDELRRVMTERATERDNELLDSVERLMKEPRKVLRDEFAVAALTGLINNFEYFSLPLKMAKAAYEIADAMMETRTKDMNKKK